MTGQGLHPTRMTRLISVLTTASLAVVVGCAAVDDGAVDGGNEVVDDDCPIGVVEASSVSFAERLCLTAASSEAGPHVVMASDPRWSWDVQSFGAEVQAPRSPSMAATARPSGALSVTASAGWCRRGPSGVRPRARAA